MKTLGQKLAEQARRKTVRLADIDCWSPTLSYVGRARYVRTNWVQGFGGMKQRIKVVSFRELSAADSVDDLQRLLEPRYDFAPGDPMNYEPRDVRDVTLELAFV